MPGMTSGRRHEAGAGKVGRATVEPVDLAHLAAATFGDARLEREVLGLFLSQSTDLIARIAAAPAGPSRDELAHRLRGSASGIGARIVAEAAARVEEGGAPADLARLVEAVAQAQAFIRDRLDARG